VMGRPLYYDEVQNMDTANSILSCYRERAAASSFASWSLDNPDKSNLLLHAQGLIDEF